MHNAAQAKKSDSQRSSIGRKSLNSHFRKVQLGNAHRGNSEVIQEESKGPVAYSFFTGGVKGKPERSTPLSSGILPPTAIRSHPGVIQAKLNTGKQDDDCEREADKVADEVIQQISSLDGNPAEKSGQTNYQNREKCESCHEEDSLLTSKPAQTKLLPEKFVQKKKCTRCKQGLPQKKLLSNGPTVKAIPKANDWQTHEKIKSRIQATRGRGNPMDPRTLFLMQRSMGRDLSHIRIHDAPYAAQLNQELNSRAFAVGDDIFFGRGEYRPGVRGGKHLLAHELAHTVQQKNSRVGIQMQVRTDNVRLVEISCPNNTITFFARSGNYVYQLDHCNIVDGEFESNVVISGPEIRFNIQSDEVAEDAFDFGFRIAPGQTNPIRLFRGQTSVTIRAINTTETIRAASTLAEFKQMVKNTAKMRMDGNIRHMEAWKTFLTERLTSTQVEGQVLAHRAAELAQMASSEGGMAASVYNQWADEHNPLMMFVYEQQIAGRYRACTGCHATVQAQDRWRNRDPLLFPEPPSPRERLQVHSQEELSNPAPRPEGLGSPMEIPSDDAFEGLEAAQDVLQSLRVLRPYFQELGPERYNVLPANVFPSGMTKEQMLAIIQARIDGRISDYREFKRRIDDPDFDYMKLRPVVNDLLPLALPSVQEAVRQDIESAENWETVKSIVVGAATIGTVLLIVFPPTSALGIGGALALEAGTIGYGIHSGLEMYHEGSTLALSRGADDVIDPEMQRSADTMMAMGLLTVGLSSVAIASTGFRSISLIRGTSSGARAASSPIQTIEAQLEGGGTARISGLNGSTPKLSVLDREGRLIAESDLTPAMLRRHTVPFHDLERQGIRGATPRAGTPQRPVHAQGGAPTCGPVSCEMVAVTGGPGVSEARLVEMLQEAGNVGVTSEQMVQMLRWNSIASEARTGWTVADLASATRGGNPAIATIRTANPTHPLHAVVVDGVTVRSGQRVVAIRNPWGVQYFQAEDEFAKIFTGNAVEVLYWR